MLLGGIRYLLPVIEAAHKHGYYVITADYIPDNIAHKYSDEYVNVSIIDKEAVLKVAQEKQIDGIMSFGVDPGVVTAAYVAEKMGLPNVGPYESVEILQNKDKFRAFLAEHNFNVPKAKGYNSIGDALNDTAWLTFPMIVKPTDSAGSKGVTRVDSYEEYEPALRHAFECSHSGHVIVEQFIEKVGYTTGSDSFSVDGKLVFVSFDDQHFDENAINPYTPSAHTWPSTMLKEHQDYLAKEVQRLISLLHVGTTLYNIEARVGVDGKPYIMEVSPRAGGNRLCEVLRMATGVNLIDAAVQAAMGERVSVGSCVYDGYWANVILHSEQDGVFESASVCDDWKQYVREFTIYPQKGTLVHAFRGANDAIGTAFLRFDRKERMEYALMHQSEWLNVIIK